MNIEEVRSLVPILKDMIYLSNGNIGLCNIRVKDAMTNFLVELESGFKFAEKWSSEIDDANTLFADLIGGRGEEVVGIPNTTTGINLVAHMIDPERGSNVVVNDLEFNTSTYPWLSRIKDGVEVKWVNCVNGEILLEDVEKAVDDQTSALVVSHVSWISGFRQNLKDLSEIAHDHGAYLIVDAAQSAGAVTLDVREGDIDFLACCSFKWLLGPPGAGFLYIHRDLIEKFEPPLPGYMGVENPFNFDIWNIDYKKSAYRFRTGIPNFIAILGVRAGLQLIHDLGIATIQDRILSLSGYLIEKAMESGIQVWTPREAEKRAGIVNLTLKEADEIHKKLLKQDIYTYLFPNTIANHLEWSGGGIRADPGIYNNKEDIEIFVETLSTL